MSGEMTNKLITPFYTSFGRQPPVVDGWYSEPYNGHHEGWAVGVYDKQKERVGIGVFALPQNSAVFEVDKAAERPIKIYWTKRKPGRIPNEELQAALRRWIKE